MGGSAKARGIILSILLAAVFLVNSSANAQLIRDGGNAPPEMMANTKPSSVNILSPANGTIFSRNQTLLKVNVSLPESAFMSQAILLKVSCRIDWQTDSLLLFYNTRGNDSIDSQAPPERQFLQASVNMTGIPDGNHSLTVTAHAGGYLMARKDDEMPLYLYHFETNGSSTAYFAVDTVPPEIGILTIENSTYETPDLTLSFNISEAGSLLTYSLDGKSNITISGNTTLAGLSNGPHNLTVYATDTAGNIGASKTIFFSVEIPFPMAVVAVSVSATAVVVAAILIYLKKRRTSSVEAIKNS